MPVVASTVLGLTGVSGVRTWCDEEVLPVLMVIDNKVDERMEIGIAYEESGYE